MIQKVDVLDVPYFHTVFTVPKELYPLMYCNQRILGMTDQTVTYLVKDYRNGGRYIPHTIKGIDFLRMFLMHVLPKGFVRIRHYRLQVYDKKNK